MENTELITEYLLAHRRRYSDITMPELMGLGKNTSSSVIKVLHELEVQSYWLREFDKVNPAEYGRFKLTYTAENGIQRPDRLFDGTIMDVIGSHRLGYFSPIVGYVENFRNTVTTSQQSLNKVPDDRKMIITLSNGNAPIHLEINITADQIRYDIADTNDSSHQVATWLNRYVKQMLTA